MTLLQALLAQADPTPPEKTAAEVASAQAMARLAELAIEWGARLVGVVIVLAAAWVISTWIRRAIYRLLDRPRIDQTLVRFLANAAKWAVLVMALVACLGIFGINTTSVAAVIGATGLAIGLALQGSLSNLAAGVLLLILRPFRVGDVIQVTGNVGTVDDIDLFNTKLDTGDNRRLIIPNSQLVNTVIENTTHHPRRRVDVTVSIAHSADVEQTRRVLGEAAESTAGRLENAAVEVVLAELAPAGVNWQVQVWAASGSFGAVKDRLNVAIKRALEQHDIAIAIPSREVVIRGGGGAEQVKARA